MLSRSPLIIGLLLVESVTAQRSPAESGRLLDCESTFTASVSEADLAKRFGAANVVTGPVYLGEGRYEEGTLLFGPTPADRVEIAWKDKPAKRQPQWVRIRGGSSHWQTPEGLTLGLELRTIERMNRRPFRLLGFHWDYQGTVMSWSGGRLEPPPSSPCRTRVRLRPTAWSAMSHQVSGERRFSSGHPAMQALNPRTYDL